LWTVTIRHIHPALLAGLGVVKPPSFIGSPNQEELVMPVHITPLQGQELSQSHAGPESCKEEGVVFRVLSGAGFKE
jgi:hypothetical protein